MIGFLQFASAHGLMIRDLRDDGDIHRCPTASKPRSDNGAYFCERGRGWVQDWAISDKVHWWTDEAAAPWTDEEKAAAQRRMREAREKRIALATAAARLASSMIDRAKTVIPTPPTTWRPSRQAVAAITAHPYLIKKGFPAEPGLILDGELLVPMYNVREYTLVGIQRIQPDGEKRFLKGQRSKGAIHRFGANAREVWLCEGFATALSVRLALKKLYRQADVIVCFSAGNLALVAGFGIGTHVAADNDESHAGEDAAIQTGLPYAMPAKAGMDMNDLHLAEGCGAVCDLLIRRI